MFSTSELSIDGINLCNSGQCKSAELNVKNIIPSEPNCLIISDSSQRRAFQNCLDPRKFSPYCIIRSAICLSPAGCRYLLLDICDREFVIVQILSNINLPFLQCPPVGVDGSCGVLISVTGSGATVIDDPSQPPYDTVEDTLVGVQNSSSRPLSILTLRSQNAIFGFDGDGLCAVGSIRARRSLAIVPSQAEPGTELFYAAGPQIRRSRA